MLRFAISSSTIIHPSDDMTLDELVPKTDPKATGQPKGKAKGQPKAKQEAWHTVLDQIVDDQQSEMYRDALLKEKRVREEAERKGKERRLMQTSVVRNNSCSLQSSSLS